MVNIRISKLLKVISEEISRESGSNSRVYEVHRSYDKNDQRNRAIRENYKNKSYMTKKSPNPK